MLIRQMKAHLGVIIILLALVNNDIVYADDVTAKNNVQHLETTLESALIRLNINADIAIPDSSKPLAIYTTDYARADDVKWREMFFGGADTPVTDELADWDLEREQVFYPDLEHAYSIDELFTRYVAHEARLYITYKDVDVTAWWGAEKKDSQAEGLQTTPKAAKELAQNWIDKLAKTINWSGLEMRACYSMPPYPNDIDPSDSAALYGFYIIEYKRVLDGIPVASDKTPFIDDTKADIHGDVLQVLINDDGIFQVIGYYRDYTEAQTEALAISLEDAIEIVHENMDYVMFDNEASTFEIREIELCYRLTQMRKTYDKDAIACTQARPAWRFATTVNRNMFEEFVMFIDAITGEVLP